MRTWRKIKNLKNSETEGKKLTAAFPTIAVLQDTKIFTLILSDVILKYFASVANHAHQLGGVNTLKRKNNFLYVKNK